MGKKLLRSGYAWHQAVRVIGGRTSSVLHLNCASCTSHIEYVLTQHFHPEKVKKWFERKGWELELYSKRSVACPACIALRKPPAQIITLHPAPEARQPTATALSSMNALVAQTAREWRNHRHNKGERPKPVPELPAKPEQVRDARPTETTTSKEGNPMNAIAATAATVRPLTAEERAKVRGFLERYFDEERGYYLEGQSDETIGRKAEVPFAAVTALREAAYGPLKGDPELIALKEVLAQQRKELDALLEKAGRLEQSIATTERKVNETIARKFKP